MIFSCYVIIIIYTIYRILINCLSSISLVNIGFIGYLIGIKVFISIPLLIGNIIIIYLLGIVAVIIDYWVYYLLLGLILTSFNCYLFLTSIELIILLLLLLELVSIIFQSLTLANRLSINLIAGSLLLTLLLSLLGLIKDLLVSFYIVCSSIIFYSFEIITKLIQVILFCLLSIEYSISLLFLLYLD